MSTYLKQTKHPITGEWHEATWIDDFYGRHRYGVQFPDGGTYNPEKTKLETRDDETVSNTEKIEEMVRDFCSVVPKSKSEVRQRIQQALAEERERVVGILENNRGETKWGDADSNEVMTESINSYIIAVKDDLSSLDTNIKE